MADGCSSCGHSEGKAIGRVFVSSHKRGIEMRQW